MDQGLKKKLIIGVVIVAICAIIIYIMMQPSGQPSGQSSVTLPAQSQGLKYVGCYKDEPVRAINSGWEYITFAQCRDKAQAAGAKFFGIQNGDPNTTVGACFVDPNTTMANAQKYGVATNCVPLPSQAALAPGAQMGGTWSNAIYTL